MPIRKREDEIQGDQRRQQNKERMASLYQQEGCTQANESHLQYVMTMMFVRKQNSYIQPEGNRQ